MSLNNTTNMLDRKLVDLAPPEYWDQPGAYYGDGDVAVSTGRLGSNRDLTVWQALAKYASLAPGAKRDLTLWEILSEYARLAPGARVLELGCGGGNFLVELIRRGFCVQGIDTSARATELANSRLRACSMPEIARCSDATDLRANEDLVAKSDLVCSFGLVEHFADSKAFVKRIKAYLSASGYIVTTVPNFHGINLLLQRFVDSRILTFHVLHTVASLKKAHEAAGFATLTCRYRGFFNGYLSEACLAEGGLRKTVHTHLCRYLNMLAEVVVRATKGRLCPNSSLWSPQIVYVGQLMKDRP